MDYPNGKAEYCKKEFGGKGQQLEVVSLKDVSLKIRRKEAKKPLFLIRYE